MSHQEQIATMRACLDEAAMELCKSIQRRGAEMSAWGTAVLALDKALDRAEQTDTN
jgi:hypothetical protein